jgi:hypothetical protein
MGFLLRYPDSWRGSREWLVDEHAMFGGEQERRKQG